MVSILRLAVRFHSHACACFITTLSMKQWLRFSEHPMIPQRRQELGFSGCGTIQYCVCLVVHRVVIVCSAFTWVCLSFVAQSLWLSSPCLASASGASSCYIVARYSSLVLSGEWSHVSACTGGASVCLHVWKAVATEV
jgi:hypothetical protein